MYTLFVSVLVRLTPERRETAEIAGDGTGVFAEHAALVGAVIARDSSLAKHRMMRHLEALAQGSAERSALRDATVRNLLSAR